VTTFVGATLSAVLWLPALILSPAALEATPQETAGVPSISLERIREELEQPPPRRFETDAHLRLPFKSRVDQRVFVPTLEEHLHKVFDLNLLQRQSAEWASQCCGFDIGYLVKSVDRALQERKIRKTREQIARELAELEAARKASSASPK
jgi:hypothetical protein